MKLWRRRKELHCVEFVELVTDYLEGALPDREVRRIDEHLHACAGCHRVLDQWREVIHLTGMLRDEQVDAIDPEIRADLMAAFRDSRGG